VEIMVDFHTIFPHILGSADPIHALEHQKMSHTVIAFHQ
jgi:hypothetical protein